MFAVSQCLFTESNPKLGVLLILMLPVIRTNLATHLLLPPRGLYLIWCFSRNGALVEFSLSPVYKIFSFRFPKHFHVERALIGSSGSGIKGRGIIC